MSQYEDIINTPYPLSTHDYRKHPRASMESRAAIFSPFAALRGFEDVIDDQAQIAKVDVSMTAEAFEESQ